MEKAQLIISRNRIGTDGKGIRTLVSFAGCPLNCRFCINPHLKREVPEEMRYTPESLLNKVSIDRHFFIATGGGVTFSGGEPLLHGNFIREFAEIADSRWSIDIETSLFASRESIAELLDVVDTWIVDIKTADREKYEAYTGKSNARVIRNLEYLDSELATRLGKKLVIRVPVIPEYTDSDDVEDTVCFLKSFLTCNAEFDTFEYVRGRQNAPVPDGKRICRIMRALRQSLIEANGGNLEQRICTNQGNCPGTCPMCEMDTVIMNSTLDDACAVNYEPARSALGCSFPGELDFRINVPQAAESHYMLMGEATYPMITEGIVPASDESLDEE